MISSTMASSFAARQFLDQVLWAAGIGRDERQIDLRLHRGGEFDLGAFGRIAEPLQRHFIALACQVQTFVLLEFLDQPIHDALVDVVAAQVRVAIGGLDFDHALANFQDGNIKSSAAEVVDGNRFVLLLVQAVGERRRRGFVDDALHFQAGDLAGIFGGLALASLK